MPYTGLFNICSYIASCVISPRRRWDSKASIINAFTTFLFLSFLFVSFTLLNTFHVQYNYGDILKKCILYYDNRGMQYTGVYHIGSNCWLWASNSHHFSNNSHSVPHKIVQEVCRMLRFSEVAWSACLWNHFRESPRMEPMVLVTSGWLLHHYLFPEYQLRPHCTIHRSGFQCWNFQQRCKVYCWCVLLASILLWDHTNIIFGIMLILWFQHC